MKKTGNIILYISVLALSVLFIFFGNQYINSINSYECIVYDRESELDTLISARVLSIDNVIKETEVNAKKEISFTAKVFGNCSIKGDIVEGIQYINIDKNIEEISVGDKVVLLSYGEGDYIFQHYYRFDKICIFCVILALFILMIGGIKGLNTIISLTLTCLFILLIYIPSIKAGFNIYTSTIVISICIMIMMLSIVYGVSKKSIITALSCSSGIIISGGLSFFMDNWMKLTGYYNEDMYRLKDLLGFNVDVNALIFAMITIGALGAITDVSMSITSPLCEMKEHDNSISYKALIKSGFNIGKDFMGTMTNTLVLAYIGSSLIMVLIYAAANYPLENLLNQEEIIIEFLQSLIGCAGILFTIPFTTIIASLLLCNKSNK